MILLITSISIILGFTLLSLLRQFRAFRLASVPLAVMVLFLVANPPALANTQIAALGASDEAVSTDETRLKLNPGEQHYSGLRGDKFFKRLV